ncbi:hypothetical protein CDAR_283871 [Caerostris darwini]|uniref:Uncharacterized protein n=1 Tax=Caerostris darwini TaxID=1538125 RepID=A0AAV4NE79_9ARAC|nr:hypothetical protein CDAR_283871 [Caerostris darwini]
MKPDFCPPSLLPSFFIATAATCYFIPSKNFLQRRIVCAPEVSRAKNEQDICVQLNEYYHFMNRQLFESVKPNSLKESPNVTLYVRQAPSQVLPK